MRRLRPLARRRLIALRPFLVLIFLRKPWVFFRRFFLGWSVRFICFFPSLIFHVDFKSLCARRRYCARPTCVNRNFFRLKSRTVRRDAKNSLARRERSHVEAVNSVHSQPHLKVWPSPGVRILQSLSFVYPRTPCVVLGCPQLWITLWK